MFSLDNYLVEKTTFIIKLFKYVHPNYLTLLGGILNFVLIYDLYFSDKIIFPILVFILRVLLDIYDGAVARYFNKSSKIGGIFDTVSDLILAFFLILYILNKVFNISFIFSFILTIIFLLKILHIMKINNSLIDHNNLRTNIRYNITSIIAKIASNNIILFIFIIPPVFFYQKTL